MKKEINTLITQLIKNFKEDLLIDDLIKNELITSFINYFECDISLAEEISQNISELTINDLLIGKAHYTKKANQTLQEFKNNEITLRIAAEKRANNKNNIDNILENIGNTFKTNSVLIKPRLTNLTSFSAYIDRLITERIKQYNFSIENKIPELQHQEKLSNLILEDIDNLLKEVKQFGYFYIGEKRTFDEKDIITNLKKAK